MVIVEASIVFPTMFLVIFLMMFAGNAYWQKCRMEAIVDGLAIDGAAYCADPMLINVENNSIPGVGSVDAKPYRFIFTGGMEEIKSDIEDKLNDRLSKLNTGLFSGMKPSIKVTDVKYNNGFIYSTFSIDVESAVTIPVRLLGAKDFILFKTSNHIDMPVTDTTEFIKNVDMIEDYMARTGITDKINEIIQKVKDLFGK